MLADRGADVQITCVRDGLCRVEKAICQDLSGKVVTEFVRDRFGRPTADVLRGGAARKRRGELAREREGGAARRSSSASPYPLARTRAKASRVLFSEAVDRTTATVRALADL